MEKLVKQIITFPNRPQWSWPKDLLVKLLSLLFAIFLWYFVAGEDRVDMNVEIPVEIINLPRNLIISNQFKNQLDVTVSGPRSLIRGIEQRHVSRSIDLSKAQPGSLKIYNDLDSIPFPRGLTALRIQPTNITLLLDQLGKRDIPIKAATTGKLPDNLELSSISLEPSTLSVTGPSATFKDITTLWTEPINLSNLSGPVTQQIPIKLTPQLVELAGESIVSATVKVREKIVTKVITNLSVKTIGLSQNFYAKLNPTDITIEAHIPYGTMKETKDLRALFLADVDLSNIGSGTYDIKVKVAQQSKISVISVKPDTIQVEIWDKRTKKRFR